MKRSDVNSEEPDWDPSVPEPEAPSQSAAVLGRLLAVIAKLVPAFRREEWIREWRAELWHVHHERATGRQNRLAATRSLICGIVVDAAWLRIDALKDAARGSAGLCLWQLAAACVCCAAMERVASESWPAFWRVLEAHFVGGFAFIAAPAVFASVVTYPLRPLRCDRKHARDGMPGMRGMFSPRTRWNLFLSAKIVLILALAFLGTVVATAPLRMTLGHWADWVELPVYAFTVTTGLRWALLNQEQRCQRCLRMLSQPTRVGLPSRNFLEWSGTELVCSDGHGLLHIPEMRGSWCWYDLWVELDNSLTGLFSS